MRAEVVAAVGVGVVVDYYDGFIVEGFAALLDLRDYG